MKGELTILPVLVSACRYQITELSAIQFALPPNKSIAKMGREERREAWVRLSEMIEHALNGRTAGTRAPDGREGPPLAQEAPLHAEMDDVAVHGAPALAPGAARTHTVDTPGVDSSSDPAFARVYTRKLSEDPLLTRIQVLDMDHSLALEEIYVRVQVHREHRFRSTSEPMERNARDPLSLFYAQQKYLEERERAGMEPDGGPVAGQRGRSAHPAHGQRRGYP